MDFSALELLYAQFYRNTGDIQRIAETAGLDPTKFSLQGTSPATLWHGVLVLAEQEDRMGDLYALVRKEHPRNSELPAAWATYQESAQPPAQPLSGRPRGQAGDALSDYRNDGRDARIDRMQRDMADIRVQMAGLVVQVSALTEMVRKQNEHDAPSLSNAQFAAIMASFALIAILVFAATYYGGNR